MRKEWILKCKQTLFTLCVIALASSFNACSSDSPQEETEKEPEIEQPVPENSLTIHKLY